MNVIGLSDYHEGNLRKLAAYLLSDALAARFDMWEFACDHNKWGATECGSVGCAVGHAPFVGIPKVATEPWSAYGERVFGLKATTDFFAGVPSPEWQWCFFGEWKYRDNTPRGAALRILWLLEKGLPADWDRQMTNKAPLCYENWEPTPEIPVVILTKEYECEGVRRPRAKQICA